MTDSGLPAGFVVRLLGPDGRPAGFGVLVGPREIVTCAHVVNAALGRALRAQDQPQEPVVVEFPLLNAVDGGPPPQLTARVERWLAPPREGVAGRDFGGLVLTADELPAGAAPAQLAANQPVPGRVVDVFGYPREPLRPDGVWVEVTVRGQVTGGRLQLGSTTEALRVQRGFAGSPVWDRSVGSVIGLIAAAANDTGARDSYAIPAEQLRRAWPEVLDPLGTTTTRARTREPDWGGVAELTVLHVSDPQFGKHDLFGGNGGTLVDQARDILFQRLHDDLDGLARESGLRPDLMVVTGDLTERGLPGEFEQVVRFLAALAEAADLPRGRVAVVPGNHDVNRLACQGYFLHEASYEREPRPPYWPKWEHFAAALAKFYEGVEGVSFTPDEPWTLFEMRDLAVVVAGLNSSMAESHRDGDHYGWVGERQLRWFADRLAGYRERGWLRLAAVHHNVVHAAVLDEENLRDTEDLDRWLGLGQRGAVNLLLHGHTHDGRLHRLPSGLVALSTGSAAVTAEARPQEVSNQYQLVTIQPGGLIRHARQYAISQRRWLGDTRVSRNGSDWRDYENHPFVDVGAAFAVGKPGADDRPGTGRAAASGADQEPEGSFFDRVLNAASVAHADATATAGKSPGEPEKATQRRRRRIRVFLCHASEDKQATRELCNRLLVAGYDVWFDERSLLPGQDWQYEISAAMKSSNIVIVVLSRHSVDKVGYVQRELRLALDAADERPEGAIFIIPLRLRGTPVPPRLAKWHWLDTSSPDWFDRLLQSLRAVEITAEPSSRLRSEQPSSQVAQAGGETGTDLEGFWEGNEGGFYYVRQIGDVLWWATTGGDFASIFRGTVHGNLIRGSWADVPLGRLANWGSLSLLVNSPRELVRDKVTGFFSATQWERAAPRPLRFPTDRAQTAAEEHDLRVVTGLWTTSDGGTYFLRQHGMTVWWLGLGPHKGTDYMSVFRGDMTGNRLSGEWADVPGGIARGSGQLEFAIHWATTEQPARMKVVKSVGPSHISPTNEFQRVGTCWT